MNWPDRSALTPHVIEWIGVDKFVKMTVNEIDSQWVRINDVDTASDDMLD